MEIPKPDPIEVHLRRFVGSKQPGGPRVVLFTECGMTFDEWVEYQNTRFFDIDHAPRNDVVVATRDKINAICDLLKKKYPTLSGNELMEKRFFRFSDGSWLHLSFRGYGCVRSYCEARSSGRKTGTMEYLGWAW